MNERERELLVNNQGELTLEGVKCRLAGWKNEHASISAHFGGFWRTDWETAKRVVDGDKNFTARDVRLHSWLWAGFGVDVPEALRHWENVRR